MRAAFGRPSVVLVKLVVMAAAQPPYLQRLPVVVVVGVADLIAALGLALLRNEITTQARLSHLVSSGDLELLFGRSLLAAPGLFDAILLADLHRIASGDLLAPLLGRQPSPPLAHVGGPLAAVTLATAAAFRRPTDSGDNGPPSLVVRPRGTECRRRRRRWPLLRRVRPGPRTCRCRGTARRWR